MTVSRLLLVVLLHLSICIQGVPLEESGGGIDMDDSHHVQQQRRLNEDDSPGVESDEDYAKRLESHKELLHYSPDVEVLGPSVFPKPTDYVAHLYATKEGLDEDNVEAVPYLQPTYGKHRPDQDAVIAFAAEYVLDNYMVFIESLRKTGFQGDIVLSVTEMDMRKDDLRNYLSTAPGVVIYVPQQECYNFEGEIVESAKGGMRTCMIHNLYGVKAKGNDTVTSIQDPRPSRALATARYEMYWLMMHSYNPSSWILVIDARDTYFQADPFKDVPRNTDPSGESGLLYFFGENIEATRLGKSKQNAKWIRAAYGEAVGQALDEKPTICSGASMGEQVAMESYVRAMVAESDHTGTKLMGADQGFHNFLYYSNKLKNSVRIHDIVVFDQGTGIVNNMGALRTKALNEWGNGKLLDETKDENNEKLYRVLNWDGVLSPVAHQFDRHKELTQNFFRAKAPKFIAEWRKKQSAKD